jgi:antitoxin component YwqK of YwqJK toxin-antitoxin module
MKRLLILGFLLLALIAANAQDMMDGQMNQTDNKGRKQGSWRVYDDGGNLKYTGHYANGKPVGVFTYYYPKGAVKAVLTNLDSGAVTYAKNYHENGKLMAEGKYVHQKKDSTWLYYSAYDGTLSTEEHYLNTVKDGVWKTYYPEGQVAEEVIYRNGLREGPWIQYFTDGKVKMKVSYINDKLEGQYFVYHLNGNVEVSGTYVNSEKDGTWIYLDDTGATEKREEYKAGLMIKQEIIEKAE